MENNGGEIPSFTALDRARTLFRVEMLAIVPIYLFFLIPVASLLAWAGRQVDKRLFHLPDLVPWPWNLAVFVACVLVGGAFLIWCYSYLILEGEGGPVPPFSRKTKRLVTIGPYAYVRHPSILAKLVGVVGLGVLFNSVTFLFVIVPLLLAGSLVNNHIFQEKPMEKFFGEEYLRYRAETPSLVPKWERLKALFRR